jgi:hypothetical protein
MKNSPRRKSYRGNSRDGRSHRFKSCIAHHLLYRNTFLQFPLYCARGIRGINRFLSYIERCFVRLSTTCAIPLSDERAVVPKIVPKSVFILSDLSLKCPLVTWEYISVVSIFWCLKIVWHSSLAECLGFWERPFFFYQIPYFTYTNYSIHLPYSGCSLGTYALE